MSDQHPPARPANSDGASPFQELLDAGGLVPEASGFTTAFRGYDKDEVDAALATLNARVRTATEQISVLKQHQRRAASALAQSREKAELLETELATADAERRDALDRVDAEVKAAKAQGRDAIERAQAASAQGRDEVDRLQADLTAAEARAADAEKRVQTLSDELVGATADTPNRPQFEEVLRVAEEQAGVLLRNATVQGERLLEVAREEIDKRHKDARAEAEAIIGQAQHDAQQARLRIDTELTAHEARLEREAAHATEKISQAEREAAAIRAEAEKGAAALRSMVARETDLARAEADEAVREQRMRALEFEASLTRRQDDAQQEFLMLHNQAVAHAERITLDANEQVAASLEHAQRVASKAEDFERLMRAQAQQIEADANIRARETLEKSRDKAQRILELVSNHSQSVLRDAEDRTRQLRWQQHQLVSFMAEVKELIRPETPLDLAAAAIGAQLPVADSDLDETLTADVDAELAELVEQGADDEATGHDEPAEESHDDEHHDGGSHEGDGQTEELSHAEN
ncbi:DivIVA domain-containing protein [Microbacterium sp. B2969]|uniref:DivIVA domain-containing protein n=1 Tax=Microbacterium alkaliflavum TaxID=3248839 RepID=A0ABW7QBE0_9MICO